MTQVTVSCLGKSLRKFYRKTLQLTITLLLCQKTFWSLYGVETTDFFESESLQTSMETALSKEPSAFSEQRKAGGSFSPKSPKEVSFLSSNIVQVNSLCVHPVIKSIIRQDSTKSLYPAGRIKHFLDSWEVVTQNQDILSVVQGFKIPFHSTPRQRFLPPISMNRDESNLVDSEIQEMLKKGAIQKVNFSKNKISNFEDF